MTITQQTLEWHRLRHVLSVTGFKPDEELPSASLETRTTPRWPSGIEGVQEKAGGFYGTAVIAGRRKLGKSMMALGSAIRAARDGWRVFYFDAENAPWITRDRVVNFFGTCERMWPDWFRDQFEYRPVGRSARLETLARYVSDHVLEFDEEILVVIDSVNRIAKRLAVRSKNPGAYFIHLNNIVDWAATITKETRGRVGVLLVSEMNRRGEPVGMDIEYAADCLVFLSKGSEDRLVQLDFESRGTDGGDLGDYRRVYTRCEFVKHGLRLIEEPDGPRNIDLGTWVDANAPDDEEPDPQKELGL